MNRIIGLITVFITLAGTVTAQQQVTLDLCYEKAIEQYPLTRQGELLSSGNDLTLKNLNKNYMPQMQLNGQLHYQSDVTKVPVQDLPVFGVEPLSKDWYKVTLDVNQVIYDGSSTSRQKEMEEVNYEISRQNLEVELFNLKKRINQVFFNLILLAENQKILALHKNTLESKLISIQSGVKNGSILASNEDILKAEIISMEQSIEEISISQAANLAIMNEYTALGLTENTVFVLPKVILETEAYKNNRPEYRLVSMEQRKIETSKKLMGSETLPRLSAFGQAGYGRPGYDMLKNSFDDFYMLGARLSWNFFDWNRTRKDKEILDLQHEIITTKMD